MKFIDDPSLTDLARLLTHHSSPECTVHTRIEAYTTKPFNKDKRMWKSLEQSYEEEQAFIHAQFGTSPPKTSSPLSTQREASRTASPELRRVAEELPGPLDKRERKTLFLLKATLNSAFPDHDFSCLRADHFSKESNGHSVLKSLSNTFNSVRGQSSPSSSFRHPSYQPRSYGAYPSSGSNLFPSSVPTSSSPVNLFSALERRQWHGLEPGINPALYRVLDECIGLGECTVYSYRPEAEADPHCETSDDEDSEEEDSDTSDNFTSRSRGGNHPGWFLPSDDERSSSDDEGDHRPRTRGIAIPLNQNERTLFYQERKESRSSSLDERDDNPSKHGALLWSNHWFFINWKRKRVLFITIWSRRKSHGHSPERFVAWPGARGAGARAFHSVTTAV